MPLNDQIKYSGIFLSRKKRERGIKKRGEKENVIPMPRTMLCLCWVPSRRAGGQRLPAPRADPGGRTPSPSPPGRGHDVSLGRFSPAPAAAAAAGLAKRSGRRGWAGAAHRLLRGPCAASRPAWRAGSGAGALRWPPRGWEQGPERLRPAPPACSWGRGKERAAPRGAKGEGAKRAWAL